MTESSEQSYVSSAYLSLLFNLIRLILNYASLQECAGKYLKEFSYISAYQAILKRVMFAPNDFYLGPVLSQQFQLLEHEWIILKLDLSSKISLTDFTQRISAAKL